jgi:hypothetical protein
MKPVRYLTLDLSNLRMIDPEIVLRVLHGDSSKLMVAFNWKSSPHKGSYWAKRCRGSQCISQEDKIFLKLLIRVRKDFPRKCLVSPDAAKRLGISEYL